MSASFTVSDARPDGKAVATAAIPTGEPRSASRGDGGEIRVDADGRDRRDVRVRRVGAAGLRAQGADAPGVSAPSRVVRSTIDTARSSTWHSAEPADTAAGQPGGAPLEARLVDGRQAVQEAAQGAIVAADVGEPDHVDPGLRTRDGDGRGHGADLVGHPGGYDAPPVARRSGRCRNRREALRGHRENRPDACAP